MKYVDIKGASFCQMIVAGKIQWPFYWSLKSSHSTSLAFYKRRAELVCLNSLFFNSMYDFI